MFFYDYRAKGCIKCSPFCPSLPISYNTCKFPFEDITPFRICVTDKKRIKHEYFLYFLNKNSVLFKKYTNFAPVLNKYTKE